MVLRLFCCLVLVLFCTVTDMVHAGSAEVPVTAIVESNELTVPMIDRTGLTFKRLSVAQGLAQTRVSHITQDDEGYIWFGSQHGLSRFDGSRFHNFIHKRGDPDSMSGVFTYALFKDRKGTIWVGSDQFLDAFDPTTRKFRHYIIDRPSPTVIHISQDRDGMLWLSTRQGLYRLDPDTGNVQRFGADSAQPNSLLSDDIKSTGEDRQGVFWVVNSQGLEAMDPRSGRVTHRIPLRQEVREVGFFEDRFGVFWVYYGAGNGLAIFDRKTNRLQRLTLDEAQGSDGLSGVYAVLETSNGEFWVATMGSGLLKFNRDAFAFERYRNDPVDPQSLSENRVISLFEDREGNIWTGLHATPPNVFSPLPAPFRKLWPAPGYPNELGESLVNAIFEDSTGSVWFGAGGALKRLERATGRIQNVELGEIGSRIEVLAINEDERQQIWIGTLGAGLIRLDPKTGRHQSFRYKDTDKGPSSDIITRILIDAEGTHWLTTWNGLNRFDPELEVFQKYSRPPPASNAFFSIIPSTDGGFWIGTTSGLLHFKGGTFTDFQYEAAEQGTLSNNTVNSLLVDNAGTLWVGTQNGLNRLAPGASRFESFFSEDGLPGNVVSCLLPGENGHIWMSTNRGIAEFNPREKIFSNYSPSDGLPGEDMTGWNACHRSRLGSLYFGGFAGASVSQPTALQGPAFEPQLVFTDVSVGGKTVVSRSGDTLQLASDATLEVSFAAISFRDPDHTRYRYRLNGRDSTWHVLQQSRTLNYPDLPAGRYELVVQAALQRGDWTNPGVTLFIDAQPAWWETWKPYLAVAITLVLAVLLYTRQRLRRMEEGYRLRLEERVSERNRVARELHDTLLQSFQGIAYRLQGIRNGIEDRPEWARSSLDAVLTVSDGALIEGRQAIQALRDTPTDDQQHLSLLVELGKDLSLFQDPSRPIAFQSHLDPSLPPLGVETSEQLFRICAEGLRNAFRHSGGTVVRLAASNRAKEIIFVVEDNGRGIELHDAETTPTRWGVRGMKERANAIGATLTLKTSEEGGTRLEVRLPKAKLGRGGIRVWFKPQ